MLKDKKGFTLTELTIVLALLAIVSMMFVSFMTLTQEHTISITDKNSLLTDLSSMNELFNNWVAYFDDNQYMFFVASTNNIDYIDDTQQDIQDDINKQQRDESNVSNEFEEVDDTTDIIFAFKINDFNNYIEENDLLSLDHNQKYIRFVEDINNNNKIYRFYLRIDGIVLGTNPVGEKVFTGTVNVRSLNFDIVKNPNTSCLLVKFTLRYNHLNKLTKKVESLEKVFYKTTKCNVYYGGKANVEDILE